MSKKRGNGEGSIYPIKNKQGHVVGYRGSYWVHTSDGPKRRYLSGKKREDVADELAKCLANRAEGLVFEAGITTLGEYLDQWLQDVQDTVRRSTFERYGELVELHVTPALGRIKLKSLTPAHARWFYRERLNSGLAPATVHKIHAVLHKALKAAVSDGLIPRNAAAGVKLPRIANEEINPLTAEEARRLLETTKGTSDRLEALYVLALNTGMRQGELLALRWDDLNLERGILRVRRTLTRQNRSFVLGEPKTKNSRRTIRLTAAAVDTLRAHLARQLVEMERVGSLYQPGGLVFATETGTIINPSNLRNRSFKPLLRQAGLPSIRFHDLRHTCATLLLGKDVNLKIVSEMLGHSSISITLDIYSHLLPDMQEKAAKALEETLGQPR